MTIFAYRFIIVAMASDKKSKREVSTLIPYKRSEDKICFFMQRRDANAQRLPDYFAFFGGGVKSGETPENAMLREIKEELEYEPYRYKFFKRFEFPESINNVFIIEVDELFEDKIKVREGQYGSFLSIEDINQEKKISGSDKYVLWQIFTALK